ncbi:response regulator transcription factor [Agromyces atrinae]|uniref:DNA-binding NarL/FixJ family response regulator n=1 Tax=Agromyces atrinae TaxID=592376 RepID=A0A4Q2ME77_9MICO|nr:response regulator transcription factor [Agromyces atrinae]MCI2957965.1 response regulator transcription factor [Agromyces atrinae]NYD66730.1 DNA-binding NarL/FixJ family response regulator [Agromyces atrinae]RXZ87390.1 response regulator transcription factor [Agromyces atrinae]
MSADSEPTQSTAPGFVARVAIVDDHEAVRVGLRAACIAAGYEVVTDTSTVADYVSELAGRPCDVVVLDLSLGDGSLVTDNVKLVLATGAVVLVHSIADRVASVREALAAGAAGVIPKSAPMSTVLQAIGTVARGDVLNNLEWASAIDADRDFAKAQLGRRERDVLHLYASGLPLKAVAMQLGIAHSTAREYLDRIRTKYVEVGRPAPTKVDLLRRAVEDGILPGLDPESGDDAN